MKRVNFAAMYMWLWSLFGPWWLIAVLCVAMITLSNIATLVLASLIFSSALVIRYINDIDKLKSALNGIKKYILNWWLVKPTLLKPINCLTCNDMGWVIEDNIQIDCKDCDINKDG